MSPPHWCGAKAWRGDASSGVVLVIQLWFTIASYSLLNTENQIFRSDVDVLRRCCFEFRDEFIKITDVDPFCYATIASVCMAAYRSKHLEKETIAIVPVRGYTSHTNYSPDAIRWLDFIATKENIFIENALNKKGERKIDDITVDGFCEETNTVYQFHGCFYHGCPDSFEGDTLNSLTAAIMKTLFERTANTTARLRNRGYTVIEEWEHTSK
ncbi:hypothetical protein AVEN_141589-1 [Araneus ventricosus]|uniref:Uncharacterized protein n=1 Tax=Araneus ventricosus TaxID=182803 RepID=A0A4Y2QX30_ARAVE|nr:hypothetical protein AVEN_141589-1 [Araneus ventricosus]